MKVDNLKRKTDFRSAYCFKCQDKIDVEQAKHTILLNGSSALRGHCPGCGNKVYRILPAIAEKSPKYLPWAISFCLALIMLMIVYSLIK